MQRGTSLQDELAQHFDATMDKIGRWYRHWTQGISFAAAACLTVYLNANSLELLHQLTAHPEARLELAKIQAGLTPEEKAYAASKRAGQGESQGSSPSGAEDRSYDNAVDQLADAYKIVTKDTLGGDFEWPDGWSARVRLMCGLLITVLAVGLGAPFWFDVLGRISPKAGAADRPPSSVSVLPIPAVPAPASQAGTVAVQGSATD
jgi:transposase-like protein